MDSRSSYDRTAEEMIMLNAAQVAQAITNGNFSTDELRQINFALKHAYDAATRKERLSFNVGDRVKSGKFGAGKVTKIAAKYIYVTLDDGRQLRASASALTRI